MSETFVSLVIVFTLVIAFSLVISFIYLLLLRFFQVYIF